LVAERLRWSAGYRLGEEHKMGLISQALPGLRDLRTPLTVGALWVLAGLLFHQLLPLDIQRQLGAMTRDISNVLSSIPTVALGSFAGLGVYLLGVAMALVGAAIARLVRVLTTPAMGALLAFILLAYFLFSAVLIVLIILLLIVVLLIWVGWRQEAADEPFADFLVRGLRDVMSEVAGAVVELLEVLVSTWSPTREQVHYFLQQNLQRRVDASPDLLRRLIQRRSRSELADDLMRAEVPLRVLKDRLEGEGVEDWDGSDVEDWYRLEQRLSNSDYQQSVDVLRKVLLESLKGNPKQRSAFLKQFTLSAAAQKDAVLRLEEAHVRLKVDQPALYDEYDRLRAEGEFRSAVALPVSAIFAGVGILVADQVRWFDSQLEWLGTHVSWVSVQLWLALLIVIMAAIPLLLFIIAGRSRELEALKLLYASVRQDVIQNRDVYEPLEEDIVGR
jgi:hypothetical protein